MHFSLKPGTEKEAYTDTVLERVKKSEDEKTASRSDAESKKGDKVASAKVAPQRPEKSASTLAMNKKGG